MPRPKGMEDLKLEGAPLCFKNFSGKEDRFNPPGRRVFNVILTPDQAAFCEQTGWHVKWLQPKVPEAVPIPYLSVSVSYKYKPPKVIMVCGKKKVKLDESNIDQLDYAEVLNCDLILSPNETNGPLGHHIRAYLSTMYITIQDDPFAEKYADPISAEAELPWVGQ